MSVQFDLHCHSHCSDGALAPADLVQRAVEQGVDVLSITDHDSVAAYRQIEAVPAALTLVPGIELSTQWNSKGIHVLGLDIDPAHPIMTEACSAQLAHRRDRAERIAERLERKGISGALEGALKLAGPAAIGRLHFARFLVDSGAVSDLQQAFSRYLGDGKSAAVKLNWADLETVVDWIRQAGGIAVLAHPLKYRMTRTRLLRFLQDFRAAGGQGMEVISGQQSVQEGSDLSRLCRQAGMLASCGSDFHQPGRHWNELGSCGSLPSACVPVWTRFSTPLPDC